MLEVITLIVGQLQTNCYLVADKKTKKTLIIDPGDDADYIERIVSDKRLAPTKIIATHGHFDHILAVTELKLAYKIPFLIHKEDEFLVSQMQSSARHFLGIATDPPPEIDGYIKADEFITIGDNKLKVIETPGHTPGGVCLYCQKDKILFTGDLLFAQGVGRTDFSYSNSAALQASLVKIFRLPAATTVYCGHGQVTTIQDELIYRQNL